MFMTDAGLHNAVAQLSLRARDGEYVPHLLRVPVSTSRTYVRENSTCLADVAETLLPAQHREVLFERVTVAVSDMAAANARDVPPARLAAEHAATDGVLLSPAPIRVRRDEALAYTTYEFLVTNGTNLHDIAVEHAHAVYATGVGNVLGDYRVLTGTASTNITVGTNVRLQYDWYGQHDQLAGLQTAMTGNLTGAAVTYWSGNSWLTTAAPLPETPEQQLARAERSAKLQVVQQRADRLFMSHLSETQRRTWAEHKHVDITAASGRRYRVKNYRSGNVFLLDGQGCEVRKYCAYANDPGGRLPDGDYWYTQMLALQFDERMFLRAANTWDMLRHGVFVGQGVDAETADRPLVQAA